MALALLPTALILVYRFVPPPVTLLMLVRLVEGEGLDKDWRPLERHLAPAAAGGDRVGGQPVLPAFRLRLEGARRSDRPGDRRRSTRGASTISMQVAKNVLLWPGRDPLRKLLEAPLTPQFELIWGKRRIMEVYLNVAETGPGMYGAEAAARGYFGKPASDLTRREAALIAAVLPNPRLWSPAPAHRLHPPAGAASSSAGWASSGPLLDCVR